MLTDAMKSDALRFLIVAGKGSVSLKFCERFDEHSKIWNLRDHSHPYLELLFFIDGKARVCTDEGTLDVALYDLIVYPPGVIHRETLDASSHQEIVCLWLDLGESASLPFSFKLTDDDGVLGWLCQAAHANHLKRSTRYRELEDHLLKSLLLFMEQKLETEASSRVATLDRTRAFIDDHYAEEFDIETLAGIACVTPSYLSRIFKKHLGTPPMRYRNAVRIEKAKQLLLLKEDSIEEIAEEVGFCDTKYFSHLFKTLTSLTPSQFRRKYR